MTAGGLDLTQAEAKLLADRLGGSGETPVTTAELAEAYDRTPAEVEALLWRIRAEGSGRQKRGVAWGDVLAALGVANTALLIWLATGDRPTPIALAGPVWWLAIGVTLVFVPLATWSLIVRRLKSGG